MTVQELIDKLEKIKDKSKEVRYYSDGYYEDIKAVKELSNSIVIL